MKLYKQQVATIEEGLSTNVPFYITTANRGWSEYVK